MMGRQCGPLGWHVYRIIAFEDSVLPVRLDNPIDGNGKTDASFIFVIRFRFRRDRARGAPSLRKRIWFMKFAVM